MFCPQCKAEYRPGFTRCTDCEENLVERLPEPGRVLDPSVKGLQGVWEGEDQDECVYISDRLGAAGIPFKVIQRKHQFLKGVDSYFKIGVPRKFSSEAKKIIEESRLDFTDEGNDQRAMELRADDERPSPSELHNHDGDQENWRLDDATGQVWIKVTPNHSWMIELSLRENNIPARMEASDDGSRKIFVSPADESRAREIVREIKSGAPPT